MDPEVPPPPFQADVDPKKFLGFLAILVPCINLFGALFMRVILPEPPSATEAALDQGEHEHSVENSPIQQLLHLDEHTPLLIGGEEAAREEAVLKDQGKVIDWSMKLLWKDYGFWSLGVILIMCLGPVGLISKLPLTAGRDGRRVDRLHHDISPSPNPRRSLTLRLGAHAPNAPNLPPLFLLNTRETPYRPRR